MTWFDYLLIGLWIVNTLLTVARIGKPQKPIEPLAAAVVVAINLLLAIGLLSTRGVL